jgi:soluble lytic murein transglycosylase
LERSLLAAVVKTESNFQSGAISPKGAIGLMQVMPDTGKWAAQKSNIGNFTTDRLFEPEYNISIGAWYLADLKREFNGELTLMLAAYNGGRGNVKKWLNDEYHNNPKQSLEKVPFPETRQFVRKVLWYRKVYGYLYEDKTIRTESKLPGAADYALVKDLYGFK